MEPNKEQPKRIHGYPSGLHSLQSLPDNKWKNRPKVTELPHRYVVASEEGYEDNVIFLPKLPRDEPPDICA